MTSVVGRVAMLETWEQPRRALVVEGNARLRRETCLALEGRGIQAITAPDGAIGLHLLVDELFQLDLVIADLHAPTRDAWELLHVIRTLGNEQDLRVLVTTDQPAAVAGNLLAHGADHVVDRRHGPHAIAAAAESLLDAGPRAWGAPSTDAVAPRMVALGHPAI